MPATGLLVLAAALAAALGLLLLALMVGAGRAGTAAVVLGMFLAPMSSLQPITPPPVITFADVAFVVGFALLAPQLAGRRLDVPLPYLVGALLLLTVSLLSVAVTAEPGVSIPAVIRLAYASMLLPGAFLLWRPPPRQIALLAVAYLLGVCASLVFGLVAGPTTEGRYQGLAPHPNSFGHSAAFAALLIPYLVSTMPRRRWSWYAGGVLCCYAIWISGSRASLVAFVVVVALAPLLERSVRATAALLYAGALLLVVGGRLATAGGTNAFSRLLGAGSATDSNGQRLLRLDVTLHDFFQHPLLGAGFTQIRAAEDIYVQVLSSVGVFGLLGFVLMLYSLVRPAFAHGRAVHRLAYPALLFAVVGPLTDVLWDTLPWAVLSLAMLAIPERDTGQPRSLEEPSPTTEERLSDAPS